MAFAPLHEGGVALVRWYGESVDVFGEVNGNDPLDGAWPCPLLWKSYPSPELEVCPYGADAFGPYAFCNRMYAAVSVTLGGSISAARDPVASEYDVEGAPFPLKPLFELD